MTFDPDTFDPFQPFVEEYLEDWEGWFEHHDEQEKQGRLMGLMSEIRESHRPLHWNFGAGLLDWASKHREVYETFGHLCGVHGRMDEVTFLIEGILYTDRRKKPMLIGAFPGYEPSGLPCLCIEPGQNVLAVLLVYGSGLSVAFHTAMRASAGERCPLCEEKSFLREEDLTVGELAHDLRCIVRAGTWCLLDVYDQTMEPWLFDAESGSPLRVRDRDQAWGYMRDLVSRTPGLIFTPMLPMTRASFQGLLGSPSTVVTSVELHTFLEVRSLLPTMRDGEILKLAKSIKKTTMDNPYMRFKSDRITPATVRRWRKILDIPEPPAPPKKSELARLKRQQDPAGSSD